MLPHNILLYDVPAEEYHADPAINASLLKAMAKSPSHGRMYLDSVRPPTKAMQLGTLTHLALLEPHRFEHEVISEPDFSDLCGGKGKTAKAYKEQVALWRSHLPVGAHVVSAAELATVEAMAWSVRQSQPIQDLLRGAKTEVTFAWQDTLVDMPCRGRADAITASGLVIDLKTTRDASPQGIPRMLAEYAIHLQAAHYLEFGRLTGLYNADNFMVLAVETSPPYGCAGYFIDDDTLEAGRLARAAALRSYAECLERDAWPSYPEISTSGLPRWAMPARE